MRLAITRPDFVGSICQLVSILRTAAPLAIAAWIGWGFAPLLVAQEAPAPETATQEGPAQQASAPSPMFEADIRPILRAHCLDCHGATSEHEGGLDLRQVRLMLQGGDSGPAINLQHVDQSLMLERIRSGEMPPGNAKVTPEEIAVLETWLQAGAPTARPESETIEDGIGITIEDRQWWAFRPLQPVAIPAIEDPRIRNDVDRFVLAKLQEKGLDFSPAASRRELAIRAWVDLTGLPPTHSELEAYLANDSADAYEQLINTLLESDAYGERWGRHWLDVAGYADSEGFTTADNPRPWAYFYRDYVIRSIRDDKPIDRFIQEQLAGDELFSGDLANPDLASFEPLIATGFLRTAADGTGQGGDENVARNQTVSDTLKIVSSSLLGVTLACAQCHDHRYDPLLQEDYYRLRAVFDPALDWQAWQPPGARLVSLYTPADREAAAVVEAEAQAVAQERAAKEAKYMAEAFDKELEKYEEPLRSELRSAYQTPAGERTESQKALLDANPSVNLSPGVLYQYNQAAADELKAMDAKIAEIRARKPVERFVSVVRESHDHLPETKVFHRGDYRQPTVTVMPGDLTVLSASGERFDFALDDPNLPTSGRRLAFAKHLTSGRHPLFNRVFVNRVWMNHFGRGIVGTPAEFGRLGDLPTHPELLDYLACELADHGWSLKHMHRLIMLSHTYQQSTLINETFAAIDADSLYLWRFPMKRLEAEAIRDRVLQAAGSLDSTSFGPPVELKEDEAGQVMPAVDQRRSVYLKVRRTQPVSFLAAFDAPIMETNCERRTVSTVAPQALMLLNSEFIRTQAEQMAGLIAREAEASVSDDLAASYQVSWPTATRRWSFGYASASSIESYAPEAFVALPHFTGSAWQGGSALPDAELEWCTLSAHGGHPGTGRALVRRFIAPEAGSYRLTGTLSHGSENGDGVLAYAVIPEQGIVGSWRAFHGTSSTETDPVRLEAGQTLDLVILGGAHVTSDSFGWETEVAMTSDDGMVRSFSSSKGFRGPSSELGRIDKQVILAFRRALLREPSQDEMLRVSQWMREVIAVDSQAADDGQAIEQALVSLCQTLLGSNEFLYVE